VADKEGHIQWTNEKLSFSWCWFYTVCVYLYVL